MALDKQYKDGLWTYSNEPVSDRDAYRSVNTWRPSWVDYAPMLNDSNKEFLRSKGFTGEFPMAAGGEYSPVDAFDEISNWANQNGIVIGRSEPRDWGNGASNYMWSMFDQSTGQPIGTPNGVGNTDTMIGLLSPILMAAAGPLAAAYGGGMAGGAAAGATIGGASGGVNSFEKGGNILEGAGKGALIGGATGAAGSAFGSGAGQYNVGEALNLTDPNLIKLANQAAGTLGKSAITGKNPTQSLISSGLNAGMGLLGSSSDAGGGGGIDEGSIQVDGGGSGVDDIDWANWAQNELDNGLFSGGTMSDFDLNSLINGGQIDWSKWANDEVNGTLPRTPSTDAQVGNMLNGNSSIPGLSGLLGSVVSGLGGKSNAGALLGGLLGAASSQGGTQTQNRDPWGPAQPYLKSLLGDADAMRADLKANPFSPQQTAEYARSFALNNQNQAALPGLLSFGQNAMNGGSNWSRQPSPTAPATTPTMRIAPALGNYR